MRMCERSGRRVYATETNGVWSPAQGFPNDGPTASSMNSVDCPSLGNCVAVGQVGYAEFPYPVPAFDGAAGAVETNGVWGPVVAPIGATDHSDGSPGMGVSCVAVGFCYAVGQTCLTSPMRRCTSPGHGENVKVINPVEGSLVNGISCSPSNICTAVGDGTYWVGTVDVWDTFSLPGIDMSAISCTDATDCTAVGSNGYATESGGVWGSPTGISGFPVGTESIAASSCVDATDCTAVGYDGADVRLPQPFYVKSTVPPTPPPTLPPPVTSSPADPARGACTAARRPHHRFRRPPRRFRYRPWSHRHHPRPHTVTGWSALTVASSPTAMPRSMARRAVSGCSAQWLASRRQPATWGYWLVRQ